MAYQMHLPSDLQKPSGDGEFASLSTERDRLAARWEKGLDFLEGLRERKGQDAPEYDRLFAEWERIDADYRRVCDRIALAEMNERIKREGRALQSGDGMHVTAGAPYPEVSR